MGGDDALTLRYLTLQPTPLAKVPDPDDSEFEHNLVEEARTLLESDLWAEKKDWHGGLVTTYALPTGRVTYDPEIDGGKKGKSPNGEFWFGVASEDARQVARSESKSLIPQFLLGPDVDR